MNIEINLKNDNGYKWVTYKNVKFKGYSVNSELQPILESLANCKDEKEITEAVKNIYGNFAIVISFEDKLVAFVDRVRSIPIFYEMSVEKFELSDIIDDDVLQKHNIDEKNMKWFEGSTFTVDNNTLMKNLFQIPAGHYLVFDNRQVSLNEYFRFEYAEQQLTDVNQTVFKLKDVYESVFRDFTKFIGDRTAVIPLSGGHDSRLIAYYLKKYGCKKIIAYSYGETANLESNIAEKVCKELNIEYHFVNYQKDKIGIFKKHKENYLLYAGCSGCIPGIQEFVSVAYLLEKGVIPEDAIMVPGLGGILTGHNVKESYLKSDKISALELVNFVYSSYFSAKKPIDDDIKDYLYKKLGLNKSEVISGNKAIELFEYYTIYEEQAKFIANIVRQYDYFGLKWAAPLFDFRIFDIWQRVSNELRFDDMVFKEMESYIYPDNILSIRFTGSKEMKHFQQTAKPSVFEVYKKRFIRYFLPRKTHYMNKFFDLSTIYILLLQRRSYITCVIRYEMLKYFKKHILK